MRVLCNNRFGDAIMICVDYVLFQPCLDGPTRLTNAGHLTRARDLVNPLALQRVRFFLNTFEKSC